MPAICATAINGIAKEIQRETRERDARKIVAPTGRSAASAEADAISIAMSGAAIRGNSAPSSALTTRMAAVAPERQEKCRIDDRHRIGHQQQARHEQNAFIGGPRRSSARPAR
jgi:hypothetical protein